MVKQYRLNLRLDEETYTMLKERAKKAGKPVSTLTKDIITELTSESGTQKETGSHLLRIIGSALSILKEEKADDRAIRNLKEAIEIIKRL